MLMRWLSNARAGIAAARAGRLSLREGLLIKLQVMAAFVLSFIVAFSVIGPVANWFGVSQGVEVALVFGFFLLSFFGIVGWMFYLDVKATYKEQENKGVGNE